MEDLPSGAMDIGDSRVTAALISDVIAVLRAHGYREPAQEPACSIALGRTVEALLNLARSFEGLQR